ncbi:LacI family DNA-binding transcriptional regulator [Gramella sp. AN32]|uniref:LacI family DNA-binding transcriptional regulator n=1 Tax=Christiangramia antarctica TaxID=2058158 RepID=A0ABW5X6J1_9FLAO|nr:LacI family DNA-binding transcriptional regulator [Gramella sp. AN32]MCM4154836.1 LacI family transcriptional regulator [Gramella sp. AN32]
MKKATIHEIAKALNIDSSTVSRALNNNSRVAKKTKEKVFNKAKELGYKPNLLASNLRKNRSNTIGVVVPRISRYFFSTIIAGIEEVAFKEGFNVVISQSLEQVKREKKIMDNFVSNRVDGVLMSIAWESNDFQHLQNLEGLGIPLVFLDRHPASLESCNKVIIDDYKGACEAVDHLIKSGCKKIAHFAGPQFLEIYKSRLKGYSDTLKKNKLKSEPKLIVASHLMKDDGFNIMRDLLEKHPDIDGVFSANDEAAVGAIKFLKKIGKKVPEDISIVGFSNDPLSEVVEPPLTTVDQFGAEMGKKACELLIQNIKHQKDDPFQYQTIILSPKLIERESSRGVIERRIN